MTALRIIGIDPGPTPGLVLLDYTDVGTAYLTLERVEALQCSAGLLEDVLTALLADAFTLPPTRALVQVERYVTGNRSSRSLVPKAGAVTRELVTVVQRVCGFAGSTGVPCYSRSASEVKPWADANEGERLARVGLLEPTKGLRHARDAGRHALFCAVHDGGVPDPLSRRSRP